MKYKPEIKLGKTTAIQLDTLKHEDKSNTEPYPEAIAHEPQRFNSPVAITSDARDVVMTMAMVLKILRKLRFNFSCFKR